MTDAWHTSHPHELGENDSPQIVHLYGPDGALVATIYGGNIAILITTLLNDYEKEIVKPENQGEDK